MKNKFLIIGIFGMLVLASIGSVYSFAVSSAYWEENPLEVSPGETKDFFLILQNKAGEGGDVQVKGEITQGAEFVEFLDDSEFYEVPFGEKKQVNLRITLPKDSVVGENFDMVVSFKTVKNSESGEFGFGSGVEREIPISVVESVKEDKGVSVWGYLVIILILVLVSGFLIYKSRKRKNKK